MLSDLETMGVSNYGKAEYSRQKKQRKSIFQKTIVCLGNLGANHHISIGIKKRNILILVIDNSQHFLYTHVSEKANKHKS